MKYTKIPGYDFRLSVITLGSQPPVSIVIGDALEGVELTYE